MHRTAVAMAALAALFLAACGSSDDVGYLRNDALGTHDAGITFNEVHARAVLFDFNSDGRIRGEELEYPDDDEFLEIVNSAEEAIDVNGWTLGCDSTGMVLTDLEPIRPGHALIVFSRSADIQNFDPGPDNQAIAADGLALHNNGDILGLRNQEGRYIALHWGGGDGCEGDCELVDEVTQGAELAGDLLRFDEAWRPGVSLARDPDFEGSWGFHAPLQDDFRWSLDDSVVLESPSASPGRRVDGTDFDDTMAAGGPGSGTSIIPDHSSHAYSNL